MPQIPTTFLLRGGLNLVSPAVATPPGMAIGAINYVADVNGYSSLGGLERFDGQARPSDSTVPATIAARRAAILAVPGTGAVRGVWGFNGEMYAFRDQVSGVAGMFKATAAGWVQQTYGFVIEFGAGTTEFVEGEFVVGGTSGASAEIKRVVLREGAWDGTAVGYLTVTNVTGTFVAETITSTSGSASGLGQTALDITAGGHYDFVNNNFYGAAKRPRMYFVNGVGFGYEWDGTVLSPIRTGTTAGVTLDIDFLLADNGDFLIADNGDFLIVDAQFDVPSFVTHFHNHLFLGYTSGSLINSSIGEPLEYNTTTGAGEESFGDEITGFVTGASTSLMIFGRNRTQYIVGNDVDDFVMSQLSDVAGAVAWSTQMLARPTYLDDGGVRDLTTTAAFGDWRQGTLTQTIQPLMIAKRDAGVNVACSMIVKALDQYRLFWDDGTGIVLYMGRKAPEPMPIHLPIVPYCACAVELTAGLGDRLFVGATDGFVYEIDRGTSFDGAAIQAYMRLPFNNIGSPNSNKRAHSASADVVCADDVTLGIAFHLDYAFGLTAPKVDIALTGGAPIISTDLYGSVDFTQPVQGKLRKYIDALFENIAMTVVSNSSTTAPHTLPSATIKYSQRGLVRDNG